MRGSHDLQCFLKQNCKGFGSPRTNFPMSPLRFTLSLWRCTFSSVFPWNGTREVILGAFVPVKKTSVFFLYFTLNSFAEYQCFNMKIFFLRCMHLFLCVRLLAAAAALQKPSDDGLTTATSHLAHSRATSHLVHSPSLHHSTVTLLKRKAFHSPRLLTAFKASSSHLEPCPCASGPHMLRPGTLPVFISAFLCHLDSAQGTLAAQLQRTPARRAPTWVARRWLIPGQEGSSPRHQPGHAYLLSSLCLKRTFSKRTPLITLSLLFTVTYCLLCQP